MSNCRISENTAVFGGGLYLISSNPTISNCKIMNNIAKHGGGLYLIESDPMIIDCEISNNSAHSSSTSHFSNYSYGGGIYLSSSNPTIRNCRIIANGASVAYSSGADTRGGGLYLESSSPMIINCEIKADNAIKGGGLYLSASNPTISDCDISENNRDLMPYSKGGGIYLSSSSPTITNCRLIKNIAEDGGGGLYLVSSNPIITDCDIRSNIVSDYEYSRCGGGLYLDTSDPTITNCYINGNFAFHGGGLYMKLSNPIITDCEIDSNSANSGGGLFLGSSSPTIVNCDISGNNATDNDGGGLIIYSSTPLIENCNISDNTAARRGGGLYIGHSSLRIINCNINNNSAEFGGGVYLDCQTADNLVYKIDIKNSLINEECYIKSSSTTTIQFVLTNTTLVKNIRYIFKFSSPSLQISSINSIVNGGISGSGVGSYSLTARNSNIKNLNASLLGIDDNIDKDPMFVDPENGDYRLQTTSPCINSGTTDTTGLLLGEYDLDGNDRVFDNRIDMGAYEFDGTFTSVKSILETNSSSLNIYPNPAIENITVESSIDGDIVIMDNRGNTLVETQHLSSIDVTNLAKGIYYAVVKENGKIRAVKSFYKR